jgi:hypothetical protein
VSQAHESAAEPVKIGIDCAASTFTPQGCALGMQGPARQPLQRQKQNQGK